MKRNIQNVTIVGAGPAACTLAILLRRAGIEVTMFFQPKRAPIIVGESLVPAVIPILRLLGVEDEVRSYSMFKGGGCFTMGREVHIAFELKNIKSSLPPYAYNVPRAQFDDTLLAAARRAGAQVIERAATLERVGDSDRVKLADTSAQPDLIVDATGRARLIPQLLGIPSQRGNREDTALFAHVDRFKLDYDGYIHITRLEHGWSWRIPLPGRVSVGVVIGAEHVKRFGATKEEQFDNLLLRDRELRKQADGAQRLTPVMAYSNYQLISTRLVGDGWVLAGDTAGFTDPIFSSGLFVAMDGAVVLARAIERGTPPALQRYEQHVTRHLQSWLQIVDYWYDGRLLTSFALGQQYRNTLPGRLIYPHLDKHLGRIFTGAAAMAPYSRWLLNFSMRLTALRPDVSIADMAVN